MKKLLVFVLVAIMILSFTGCGKSEAVKTVESLISQLGEITIDSENAIINAEAAYSNLTETEKENVENYAVLVEARKVYDGIPKTISIELNETITAGSWEFTLKDIQFSDDVGNFSEYENYLVPGGEKSRSNPFNLEENEIFAIVTYELKNIGKETLSPWNMDDGTSMGTGRFIYSDGYYFENRSDGRRAEADYYDIESKRFTSIGFFKLEPLSEKIELRVAFTLKTEVVENKAEPLSYEITFNETGNNVVLSYKIR